MTEPYLAGQSAIWVQPDGPNTRPEFLGCHQIGELSVPLGELTVQYCPDPASWGKFRPAVSYQAGPGVITSTITTYISATADWLGKIVRRGCRFPLYIFKGSCGRADVFYNWDRGFGLNPALVTTRSFDKMSAREPSDEGLSEQTFNISAVEMYEWFDLSVHPKPIEEDMATTSIWACSVPQCPGSCGDAKAPCNDLIAGGQYKGAPPAEDADVWYSSDQGETWTESVAAPFAGTNDDVMSVVCFPISATTTRWLVASDDTDLALEVAYSDDQGDTWTLVTVAATAHAIGALGPRALFCIDMFHIWLVTQFGYILFSSDGGETWTVQLSLGAGHFNAVWFKNDRVGMAVGDADLMYVTTDGGINWTLRAGGTGGGKDLSDVTENAGGDIWWVGTGWGRLYYSSDFGITWARRLPWPSPLGPTEAYNEVKAVRFANPLSGFLLYNVDNWFGVTPAKAFVWQTVNGGFSWKQLTTPDNRGFSDLVVCDENTALVTGWSAASDALILKVHE